MHPFEKLKKSGPERDVNRPIYLKRPANANHAAGEIGVRTDLVKEEGTGSRKGFVIEMPRC